MTQRRSAYSDRTQPEPSVWTQLRFGQALQQQLTQLVPDLCQQLSMTGLFSLGELARRLDLPVGLRREHFSLQAADFLPGWQGRDYIETTEESLSNLLVCQMLDYHSEPDLLIAELARTLVPGGHLLLSGCLRYAPLSWGLQSMRHRHWPKPPLGWLDTRNLLVKHQLFPVSVHWLAPSRQHEIQCLARWSGPVLAVAFLIVACKQSMPMSPFKLKLNPGLPVFGPSLQPGNWFKESK